MNRRRSANVSHAPQRDWSRVKLACVGVLLLVAWLGLWARAGWLQLVQGPELARRALKQHVASQFDKGSRGQIFDRNGLLLAKSVKFAAVYVRPAEVEDPDAEAAVLAGILKTGKNFRKRLASKKAFVYLARRVGDKTAAAVRKAGLKGVHVSTEYGRSYPNRHLAGQVLGFVGLDDQGLEGIEKAFDAHMAGRKAKYVVQRDASGRRLFLDAHGREMENLDGGDVRLTIDAHIQFFAEEELAKAVRKHKAKRGVTIVIHVPTAEILALANYPFFNPNNVKKMRPGAGRNRAVLDAYEPGSTMKPLLVASALQEGVVRPETKFDCEKGRFRYGRRTIRDTHAYEMLTVSEIVRSSSNIGAAKIGDRLGPGRIFAYYSRLGFGRPTGLPLSGESKGLVRPLKRWHQIDTATASFGQGIGVTAVQLAQAYHTLANDGVYKPLKLVLDAGADKAAPPVRVFDVETARSVQRMMRSVVRDEHGTGSAARIDGLEVGGKTGTAQKARPGGGYGDKYLASFVALIPAVGPEYLVLTMVDEPEPSHYGGVVAAPAVRNVTLKTLSYLGRMPETAKPAPAGDQIYPSREDKKILEIAAGPTPGAAAPGMVPNFSGMPLRMAVEILAEKGIVPKLEGHGLIVSGQKPAPGTPWKGGGGKSFVLRLSRPS